MTLSLRNILIAFLAVVLGSYALYVVTDQAFGKVTSSSTVSVNTYNTYTFFATSTTQYSGSAATGYVGSTATTTTATSTNIIPYIDSNGVYDNGSLDIRGAKRVTMYFSRAWGAGNTGSTNFKVQVTPNGTDWYDFNKLVQNLATSTSPTTLSSVTISAATSTTVASLDLENDAFQAVRCIAVVTTDGANSCSASVSF